VALEWFIARPASALDLFPPEDRLIRPRFGRVPGNSPKSDHERIDPSSGSARTEGGTDTADQSAAMVRPQTEGEVF